MSKLNQQPPVANTLISPAPSIFQRFENYPVWHYIILLIIPFFIYIKTVGFDFINMDDISIIYNNLDTLMHWKNIGVAFKTDAFLSPHGDFYRPVQTVSFMLDAWISGERTWMYHLSNLIYHLLTVVSLYSLLRFLNFKNITAFLLTLFFAIHPMLTAAVSWVPARGDVLIGLWSTLLLLSFGKYFATGKRIFLVWHALLFALAIFTKETAIIFPILLLFYYLFVLKEKFSIAKLFPFILIWIAPVVLFFILRHKVVTGLPPDFIFGIGPLLQDLPTIPIVLAKTFVPANLSTMPLFENGFMILGTLLLGVLIFICYTQSRKKQWLPLMGLLWFLAFLAPTLLFKLFYSKYLLEYYEHRAYLPMIGIVLLLAALLDEKLRNKFNTTLVWIALAFSIIFIPIAAIHSDDFKNSMAYFGRAAELNNPGAYTKRGEEYYNTRDFAPAAEDFDKAIDISNGQYPLAYFNKGKIEASVNKNHQAAEAAYTQALILDTTMIEGYISRADERVVLGNVGGASGDLERAKLLDKNNPTIYRIAGKVAVTSKNYPAAVENFSKAIALNKYYTEAYNDRAFVYYQLKNYPAAIKDCDETIKQNPGFLNAYYNKGMIYYDLGKSDAAIKLFDSTLALADNFYFGYFYRGMAKKQKNDMDGACKDWQQSVQLGFTMAQDTIKRYCK